VTTDYSINTDYWADDINVTTDYSINTDYWADDTDYIFNFTLI
jgi:hypothetical protein